MRKLPAIQTTEQLYYLNILRYNTCHLPRYVLATQFMDETSTVLDYGCGAGYGSWLMSGEAGEVIGVDKDATAIEYAKKWYARPTITYFNQDFCPSLQFDVITAFEVIEHVPEPEKLMAEFLHVLKSNGTLILSVPNEGVVPHASSTNLWHHRHFLPRDLDSLVSGAGFKIIHRLTQLAKGRPEIVPGSFGFTLLLVAKKP